MSKIIFFHKSHVNQYVRSDGVTVAAHDDVRTKKQKQAKDWRDETNWHTRTIGKFKTYTDEQLKFVIKDATESADIAEKHGMDDKKSGQYRDEVHYAHAELKRRKDKK